ncbi:adenosylcobinamide-GDP ribazoletransferase [Planococcus salinus]|uniref:Adenosylcobinamide-GDP ribazoletransferase n=1 Tax=Planococcus salinus TaxID=1848460 RepID=A0A3M8P9Y1_9BACL|nr:adenosylcobinamide-GDP ribazoletransferase [Planococcus salinus]RNF40050.1 adenosylcobinamide-GDP ribazoletransferase [Planococcus salinus]
MGHYITGFLLALQFFSVLPVKKELKMEKNDVTAMYAVLPLIGMLFGAILAITAFGVREYTDSSSLLLAFLIVLLSAVMTGGLHLDGLADAGDAFFSYQEREKRLEIMEDPRIGAFGTLVLLLVIIGKIFVIAEVIMTVPILLVAIIPLLSRSGLLLLFSLTKTAKETGLAAFFRQHMDLKKIGVAAFVYVMATGILLLFVTGWLTAVGLVAGLLLSFFCYRKWCLRHFGGVTGDLSGAYVEGVEWLLWIVVLLLI